MAVSVAEATAPEQPARRARRGAHCGACPLRAVDAALRVVGVPDGVVGVHAWVRYGMFRQRLHLIRASRCAVQRRRSPVGVSPTR